VATDVVKRGHVGEHGKEVVAGDLSDLEPIVEVLVTEEEDVVSARETSTEISGATRTMSLLHRRLVSGERQVTVGGSRGDFFAVVPLLGGEPGGGPSDQRWSGAEGVCGRRWRNTRAPATRSSCPGPRPRFGAVEVCRPWTYSLPTWATSTVLPM
jgi:hypothetical protein